MPEPDTYSADEFPHGLTCMDCGVAFVEGQPISQRLDGVLPEGVVVDLLCVPCSMCTCPPGLDFHNADCPVVLQRRGEATDA